MSIEEQRKILDRIDILLNLTLEHGCMPGEIEVAAYKIGSIIQKHGLAVSFPQCAQVRPPPEREQQRKKEPWPQSRPIMNFEYGEVTVIGETEKALFLHDDETESEFWIPRSQCRDGCQHWDRGDSGVLIVSKWWAEKEGWT